MSVFVIERLGLRGDGIAHGPVFAARTLPGEEVTGALDGQTLAAPKIVTPSADRVKAPCRHYARCGGCALQHASDAFVATWKAEVVAKALSAQGLTADLRPIATSAPSTRRRATLAGRRLKSGVLLGFHTRASDTIVPIPDCQLLHPALIAALPAVEEVVTAIGSRKGEVSLAITQTLDGIDLDVAGAKMIDAAGIQALADIALRHDLARISIGGEVLLTRRAPRQSFEGITLVPPPGAFLQATAEAEDVLRRAVEEVLAPAKKRADLFAGSGTFALPLAKTAPVHAVEGDAAMIAALHTGWRQADGLRTVTTEVRDLFRRPLLPDELARFDGIVMDPPRAGAEAQTAELARARVPHLAYVSCHPVTFARDAKTLVDAGYRLNWVQVVDQFRWSPHVELVASLSTGHISGG